MVTSEIAQNTESVLNITQKIEIDVNDVVALPATVSEVTENKSKELLAIL